jgi:gliding motility-associated-like protein
VYSSVNAQLILADKKLVCPNSPSTLKVNDKALSQTAFCVTQMANRYGLYYFRTCNQVEIDDAIIMAKIMNGFLATGNTEDKNDFLFRLLPNDIHWIGYYQDTTSKNYNDPPDPTSGFVWMSGDSQSRPYWVSGEPNNPEDINPGKYVVQGCRRDPGWCDIEPGLKFVGIIESKTSTIPTITSPTILWETGETTQEIIVNPPESRWYSVTITYDTRTVTDSIYIQTPKATVDMSQPGGCNPYKWKPVIETNAPLSSLEIKWNLGTNRKLDELSPEFLLSLEGNITGSVTVNSTECGTELLSQTELFNVQPMMPQLPRESVAFLNDTVQIVPFNEGPFTYSWTPDRDLFERGIFSPFFTATRDVEYRVLIEDDFGCSTTEVFIYTIDPNLKIYTPTAFSPNGDGLNDSFGFYLIENFYGEIKRLRIFNSFGESIHEAIGSEAGWDGKVNNRTAPFGQYIYVIEYEVNGVSYAKKGQVNVVY